MLDAIRTLKKPVRLLALKYNKSNKKNDLLKSKSENFINWN